MKKFRFRPWRKWLKRCLALLLGVLLFADAGVVRAQTHYDLRNGAVVAQTREVTEGDRLLQEGVQLYQENTEASLRQAIEVWQQARQWFHRAEMQKQEAVALQNIGGAYLKLHGFSQNRSDLDQALTSANQALSLFSEEDWFNQANTLHSIGAIYDDLTQLDQAINHYKRALSFWMKLEHSIDAANTAYFIGAAYAKLEDWQNAALYYSQTLALWPASPEENTRLWFGKRIGTWKAETAFELGKAYKNLEKNTEAIDAFDQAAELYQSEGDLSAAADSLVEVGALFFVQREWQQALAYFNQALPLWQEDDQFAKAENYSHLGNTYRQLNSDDQALAAYSQALPLYEMVGNKNGIAFGLNSIGRVYLDQGNAEMAKPNFVRVLTLCQEDCIEQRVGALEHLGEVYSITGERDQKIEVYQQLSNIYQDLEDVGRQARSLAIVAGVYYELNDFSNSESFIQDVEQMLPHIDDLYQKAVVFGHLGYVLGKSNPLKALDYQKRALALFIEQQDWRNVCRTLSNLRWLADVNEGIQQPVADSLEQVLVFSEQSGDQACAAAIYQNVGFTFLETDPEQALKFLKKAQEIWESTRNLDKLAETHYGISLFYKEQNRFSEALAEINQAVAIVEDLRPKSGSDTTRTAYFSTVQQYYNLKIDILMMLNSQIGKSPLGVPYLGEAINTIELTRARSLADLLVTSNLNGEQQQASSWKFFNQGETNWPDKEGNPLFQYYLGDHVSYLFTLLGMPLVKDDQDLSDLPTLGVIDSSALPSRSEIEAAAQTFLDVLTAGRRDSDLLRPAACLRQKILPKSVLPAAGSKLVIAADGILQTIPFAALPLPDPALPADVPEPDACDAATFDANHFQTYQPLINQYEIVNIPSITSVQILRQQPQTPASKTLAIFADPILTTDPRYTKQGVAEVCTAALAENTANSISSETLPLSLQAALRSTDGILTPLPCTRSEAEAILKEVNDSSQTFAAMDYEATQDRVLATPLSQYRIVHFATHGLVDDRNPELSGLVLSQVDRQGKPLLDYYLDLSDIFNLNLNADLVVLSACETGLGKDVRGEGMLGLTRGFMYAGAKRVMTSYWRVEDGSTAELMTDFYHLMLKEKLSPSAALRQAQLKMREKPTSRANQWAAFTIQGEWN